MSEATKNKVTIDLLNQDLQAEHGAIIQYLYHAWTLDLPGISGALESIAREEMYHFQWLALRIKELGGSPSLTRYPVYLEAPSFKELIMLDSKAEKEAVAQYEDHIRMIDDEPTIKLIERIKADEEHHIERFAVLAEKVAEIEGKPEDQISPEAQAKREKLVELLNTGVRHEYSVVLQYLHQAYTADDRHFGHAMEQSAIVEMKHMGALAEHVAEMGGKPAIDRNKITIADNKIDMLKANISDEEKATQLYTEQIAICENQEIRDVLSRIRSHEEYHKYEFKRFLTEALAKTEYEKQAPIDKGKKPARQFFTVGSLLENK